MALFTALNKKGNTSNCSLFVFMIMIRNCKVPIFLFQFCVNFMFIQFDTCVTYLFVFTRFTNYNVDYVSSFTGHIRVSF